MNQDQFDALTPDERKKVIATQFGGVELGANSPLHDFAKPKRAHRNLEDQHVRQVLVPCWTERGWTVNITSVVGVKPTGVTPGIPDLYCQRRGMNVWYEAKVQTRQSKAQRDFMRRCQLGDEWYVLGNVENAYAFFRWMSTGKVEVTPYNWYLSEEFAQSLDQWGYREPRKRK